MDEQLRLFERNADPSPPPAVDARVALLGLSLYQPWAYAVTHLGKRIENRPWAPWARVIGTTIALHATKARVDEHAAAAFIADLIHTLPPLDSLPRGAIVGTARVVGFVTRSDDPWFFGPYGWQLADVVALPEPIACRGMQGLWPVPPDVAARVLAAADRAREVARG